MLRVNGLHDAAPQREIAGATVSLCGDKQHGLAHGQFFGQEAVPHPVHQAIPVRRQLCRCQRLFKRLVNVLLRNLCLEVPVVVGHTSGLREAHRDFVGGDHLVRIIDWFQNDPLPFKEERRPHIYQCEAASRFACFQLYPPTWRGWAQRVLLIRYFARSPAAAGQIHLFPGTPSARSLHPPHQVPYRKGI